MSKPLEQYDCPLWNYLWSQFNSQINREFIPVLGTGLRPESIENLFAYLWAHLYE